MPSKPARTPGPLVECTLCYSKFTLADIEAGKYFVSTNVCAGCYRKAVHSPYSVTCFGKPTTSKGYGFNPKALACKRLCPDRAICEGVVLKKIVIEPINLASAAKKIGKPRDKKVRNRDAPFRGGTAIAVAFELCLKGCSTKEFDKLVAKLGCDKYRLLRVFRKEAAYGFTWTWKESDGKLRISGVS